MECKSYLVSVQQKQGSSDDVLRVWPIQPKMSGLGFENFLGANGSRRSRSVPLVERVRPLIQNGGCWSAVTFKKNTMSSMSSKLEPAIWSCDTGQRIPCFDNCQ